MKNTSAYCIGNDAQIPNHLQQILDMVQRLANILREFQSCFSLSSSDMGSTDLIEHKINTGDALSIKHSPRGIPLAKMAEAKK